MRWSRAAARPCGLGARDTLRTEMGYPLHGQDLSAEISPVAARLGWAVGWKKPAFWGREALLAERAAPTHLLWGLRVSSRHRPPAHGGVGPDRARERDRDQRNLQPDARCRHRARDLDRGRRRATR